MPTESQPSLYEVLLADLHRWGIQKTGWLAIAAYFFMRPGYMAVVLFRFASLCARKGKFGKTAAGVFRHINFHLNACEIVSEAMIGPGFHMPHPAGVVIGKATIGRNLYVHQNVTIGVGKLEKTYDDFAIFPVIGDDVLIWAGAVLAGKIRIGSNTIIGANAVVLEDVPDNCLAVGVPARVIAKSAETASPKSG